MGNLKQIKRKNKKNLIICGLATVLVFIILFYIFYCFVINKVDDKVVGVKNVELKIENGSAKSKKINFKDMKVSLEAELKKSGDYISYIISVENNTDKTQELSVENVICSDNPVIYCAATEISSPKDNVKPYGVASNTWVQGEYILNAKSSKYFYFEVGYYKNLQSNNNSIKITPEIKFNSQEK